MAWPQTGRYSPRKGKNRLPESQRRRILKRYPRCQLAIPGVCTVRSLEVHHRVDAADDGGDNDANLVGVCRECHRYVSARNSAARSSANNGTRVLREKERHPGILP
jgi:5-methylcytosine-specific restriction endonuclease McrA